LISGGYSQDWFLARSNPGTIHCNKETSDYKRITGVRFGGWE
jgi:hypothetical protein